MHTVCETNPFVYAASDAGMSGDEIDAFVDFMAWNPEAGDEIPGTGGCRKVRVAGKGKGKSGGYRVITFFTGPELPIFLITVFAKGDRADLSKRERNDLAKFTAALASEYRRKIVSIGRAATKKRRKE